MATQIGAGLIGVLYILDEPSIGLHQRDNQRLLRTLEGLRDLGNSVIVVEHDAETIRHADYILDLGPGAGVRGGEMVAAGTLGEVLANPRSMTARYLNGELSIPIPKNRVRPSAERGWLEIRAFSKSAVCPLPSALTTASPSPRLTACSISPGFRCGGCV